MAASEQSLAALAAGAAAALACYCCLTDDEENKPADFVPAAGFAGAKAGYLLYSIVLIPAEQFCIGTQCCSDTGCGSRLGRYVFQHGEQGLGYYSDEIERAKPTVGKPTEAEPDDDDADNDGREPDLAPAPVLTKLTRPTPEPEPEPTQPLAEPEFIRPADIPIANWPRERIADGDLALTIYYLRGSLPGLLREYPVPALTNALQAHLESDGARMAVVILAQPEEDGAGLFSALALDAAPREEKRPKSAIQQRRKVRSGGVNRGQLEVEGHFDETKSTVSEGAESFLGALSAVPYKVSFEYRKEFALLIEAAGSPDFSGGFGAESVCLTSNVPANPGDAETHLHAAHLMSLCDPIEPPRIGAAAAIVRLAAKDWVELTNVSECLLTIMPTFRLDEYSMIIKRCLLNDVYFRLAGTGKVISCGHRAQDRQGRLWREGNWRQ